MKKRISLIILAVLFVLPIPIFAQIESLYQSQYLELNVNYKMDVDIIKSTNTAELSYFSANYSFFPKQAINQEIINIESNGKIDGNSLLLEVENPTNNHVELYVNSKVITKNDFIRIKDKVHWPIENLPDEYKKYTEVQEIIDINDNIRILSSRLAEGEDDMFVVTNNIAEWVVDNVKYNLSTVTTSASKPASWVLENRNGVCDELTSLFISMVRSLGIPARFVVGTSYTNSPLFEEKWGSHGWAEVYFPGFGWVPYDVTYHQFGYIDATHITNGYFLDSKPIETNFVWRGRDVDIKSNELKTKIDIQNYGPKMADQVSIKINPLKDSVDFSSYNLIEAEVTNNMDYYVSTTMYIANTTKLALLDKNIKKVLIAPKQKKSYFWTLKVASDLNVDYLYTFPIVVFTAQNINASTKFHAIKDGKFVSLAYVNEALKDKTEEQSKKYSNGLDIQCKSIKSTFSDSEMPKITCLIKNTGNIFLENLDICLENDCRRENIAITEVKKIDFDAPKLGIGKNEIKIKASNDQVTKTQMIEYNILDKPSIEIMKKEYPAKVRYNDNFKVSFAFKKSSLNVPKDAKIMIQINSIEKELEAGDITEPKTYDILLAAKDLEAGKNDFNIKLAYKDDKNREYTQTDKIEIELVDLTFIQKIKVFFKGLF